MSEIAWRSANIRPRNGQRILAMCCIGCDTFISGVYYSIATFQSDSGWSRPWSSVTAWVPEKAAIRAAKAAAKGKT